MGVVEQVYRIVSIMQEGELAGKPAAACDGSVCTIKPHMAVVLVYEITTKSNCSVVRRENSKNIT